MSDGTFLLSISGQIEFAEVMSSAGSSYHCKYEFYTGPDWKIIGGLEEGLSQIANVVHNNDKVVFNFPIDVQFKSTNPFGWPQLVLTVYRGMVLEGYGRTHVPIKPGHHRLEVNLAKPKASSFLGYLGSFFGYQPELLQPKVLASTAGSNYGRKYCAVPRNFVEARLVSRHLRTKLYQNNAATPKQNDVEIPKLFNSPFRIFCFNVDYNIFKEMLGMMDKEADEFAERDSGWTLAQFLHLELNINKYNSLRGSLFIPPPESIRQKNPTINLHNNDEYCFAWSIVAGLKPPTGLKPETS